MDGTQNVRAHSLHFALLGDATILPGFSLDTFSSFSTVALFSVLICVAERILTALINSWYYPFRRASQTQIALWRAALYWFAMLGRLMYMLLAMTLHIPLILVIVTTLSICQLVVELRCSQRGSSNHEHGYASLSTLPLSSSDLHLNVPSYRDAYDGIQPTPTLTIEHPATHSSQTAALCLRSRDFAPVSLPGSTSSLTRPRARSKPEAIFIHPLQSNVARAEAIYNYGPNMAPVSSTQAPTAWAEGRGREAARALLAGTRVSERRPSRTRPHSRTKKQMDDPERRPLYCSDSEDDDSDSD